METRPQPSVMLLNNRLPPSTFHSNLQSLSTSIASEICSTFIDWSPASAPFRSYSSPYFARSPYLSPSVPGNYANRHSHRYFRPTSYSLQQWLRRVRIFFFNANASMPPAEQLPAPNSSGSTLSSHLPATMSPPIRQLRGL